MEENRLLWMRVDKEDLVEWKNERKNEIPKPPDQSVQGTQSMYTISKQSHIVSTYY